MTKYFAVTISAIFAAHAHAQSGAPTNIASYANCQSAEKPTPTVYSAALGKYCRYTAVVCDITYTQAGGSPTVPQKSQSIAGVQCPALLNPKTGVYTCPTAGACASYVKKP